VLIVTGELVVGAKAVPNEVVFKQPDPDPDGQLVQVIVVVQHVTAVPHPAFVL
jgi:hypothetical protein